MYIVTGSDPIGPESSELHKNEHLADPIRRICT
jgi:hypothetical protein